MPQKLMSKKPKGDKLRDGSGNPFFLFFRKKDCNVQPELPMHKAFWPTATNKKNNNLLKILLTTFF
jgi:hypothetical protein